MFHKQSTWTRRFDPASSDLSYSSTVFFAPYRTDSSANTSGFPPNTPDRQCRRFVARAQNFQSASMAAVGIVNRASAEVRRMNILEPPHVYRSGWWNSRPNKSSLAVKPKPDSRPLSDQTGEKVSSRLDDDCSIELLDIAQLYERMYGCENVSNCSFTACWRW